MSVAYSHLRRMHAIPLAHTQFCAPAHPQSRLTDNDGQFLLIEAALALPSWVEPENSDGRVFLYAGNVHLVAPEDKTAAKASSPPPRDQALAMVRSPTRDTLASPSVQAAIRARTEAAVEAARDHRLRINCIVPRDVARVLACEPRWIADATEAFCARDMVSMRVCAIVDECKRVVAALCIIFMSFDNIITFILTPCNTSRPARACRTSHPQPPCSPPSPSPRPCTHSLRASASMRQPRLRGIPTGRRSWATGRQKNVDGRNWG